MINRIKNYFFPEPVKTVSDKYTDYIKENPTTVAKSVGVGVVGWYTLPIIIGAVTWLPYFGAGYYVYTQTRIVEKSYSWYRRAKRLFS